MAAVLGFLVSKIFPAKLGKGKLESKIDCYISKEMFFVLFTGLYIFHRCNTCVCLSQSSLAISTPDLFRIYCTYIYNLYCYITGSLQCMDHSFNFHVSECLFLQLLVLYIPALSENPSHSGTLTYLQKNLYCSRCLAQASPSLTAAAAGG